jgi:DNA-binding CsgD family transcriptional regulator
MARQQKLRKATLQGNRNLDTYKIVLSILDKVCARLGFTYHILHQAPDASRIDLAVARVYDAVAVVLMRQRSGAPDLSLDWQSPNGVVKIKRRLFDTELDTELQKEFWKIGLVEKSLDETTITIKKNRLENYIKTEPIKTGEAWHNGNTLSETPTSGSVIQLPGGEIIRAEKMTSPYDAQAAPVMQAQSPKRITANQKEKQERQVKVKRYCEQGMSIAEMARTENVSEATIKRDLRELRMTTRQ